MGYFKLYRSKPEDKSVRGLLYQSTPKGEVLLAHTLENINHIIPALIYKVIVTRSPRFNTLMPLLTDVPGRTGIRIHGGVKPEHSKGCLLITRRKEYETLMNTFITEQNEMQPIYLEVCQPK